MAKETSKSANEVVEAFGLLRDLRHDLAPSADDAPALHPKARRAAPGRFPRSPSAGRRASRPAIPLLSRKPEFLIDGTT
jgi:hypothetical protein